LIEALLSELRAFVPNFGWSAVARNAGDVTSMMSYSHVTSLIKSPNEVQ